MSQARRTSRRLMEKCTHNVLPSDIISEILLRLPAKTLGRFKSVCKDWCSMIQTQDFTHLHLQQSAETDNERYIDACYRNNDRSRTNTYKFYSINNNGDATEVVRQNHKTTRITTHHSQEFIPSCNGLICFFNKSGKIFVSNPIAARKTISLPEPSFLEGSYVTMEPGFVFTPMIGIGFDSTAGTYKVVGWDSKRKVMIFTLGEKSWREVKGDTSYHTRSINTLKDRHVYANGALHWYLKPNVAKENRDKGKMLLFNFAKEEFEVDSIPDDIDCLNRMCWISVVDGCVCLLEKGNATDAVVRLWKLANYEKREWVCQQIFLEFDIADSRSIIPIRRGEILVESKEPKIYLVRYDKMGQMISWTILGGLPCCFEGLGQFKRFARLTSRLFT